MNKLDRSPIAVGDEPDAYKGLSSSIHAGPLAVGFDDRLEQLEIENARLHRLVAELLIKNEQLRKLD
jgi:hypothetical protein